MNVEKQKTEAQEAYNESSIEAFNDAYKDFLAAKTEREVIRRIEDDLDATPLADAEELQHGETYYAVSKEKNLAVLRYNGLETVRAIASHVDSPCLHLKPFPVQEEDNLAVLKTNYYGGIKHYHWLNIPLSLRGVAYTQSGERITITDGPTLTIPDLLPHLSKEQREKKMKEAVQGEHLNALLSNTHGDGDEPLRQHALNALHDEYGLVEDDLVSAELRLVPQASPHDTGVDEQLIAAYGHDDRSSAYTSLKALQDADPSETQLAVFYDKEEIGSEGTTSAKNTFWTRIYEDLIRKAEHSLSPNDVWRNTTVLSADVTAGSNPNFNEVHDPSNAAKIGRGVSIKKFTGGGGKSRAHDASAELTSAVIRVLNDESIPWQSGVIGKQHIGGGGTIAKFVANHGAEVLDIGVPVLGMHSPHEVLSKADLYSAYDAFKAFYESQTMMS